MALFTVNEDKCIKCKACVSECPVMIIELSDPGSVPTPIDGADMMCINCGHCLAVCPRGALTHRDVKPEECIPIRQEWISFPERVENYMCARRSIRAYSRKPVERDVLGKLINISRYAPSGHNGQPVNWLVIHSSDEVNQVAGAVIDWMKYLVKEGEPMAQAFGAETLIGVWEAGIDIICRSAPHLIVAHASAQNPMAQTDCTIALSHLELAAPAFGLGGCWAGFAQIAAKMWPPLQDILGLPEGNITQGMMMLGYPKYKYYRLPQRKEAQIIWH